jgi:predicted RNase H-like HicB family nuclease
MKYKVALHQDEEGYSVSVPGLPGCWSQGKTEVEALANIRDAIREYLDARDELLRESEVREVDIANQKTVRGPPEASPGKSCSFAAVRLTSS